MSKATNTIPSRELRALSQRAHRLAQRVERATQTATSMDVRRGGTRIGEILDEWMEEIQELDNLGDETATERAKSFATRLALAEQKIESWNLPPEPAQRATRTPKARGTSRVRRSAA